MQQHHCECFEYIFHFSKGRERNAGFVNLQHSVGTPAFVSNCLELNSRRVKDFNTTDTVTVKWSRTITDFSRRFFWIIARAFPREYILSCQYFVMLLLFLKYLRVNTKDCILSFSVLN